VVQDDDNLLYVVSEPDTDTGSDDFRKALGVNPVRPWNTRKKWFKLANPDCAAISVTESVVVSRSFWAWLILTRRIS
jgi:hypothetical protein